MDTVVNGATFTFPVKPSQRAKLEELLAGMDRGSGLFPMDKAKLLHFATWVIVPEEMTPSMRRLPECLLLVTTYNGPVRKHVEELAMLAPEGLHQLLSCCEGYHASEVSVSALNRYLKSRRRSNFVYNAYQYTSRDAIEKERILHDAIQSYLDREEASLSGLKAMEVRKKIQDFVNQETGLEWARKPYKTSLQSYLKLNVYWILLLMYLATALISTIVFMFMKLPLSISLIFTGAAILLLIGVSAIMQSRKKDPNVKRKLILFPLALLFVFVYLVGVSFIAVFADLMFPKIIALCFLIPLFTFLALLVWLRINERNREFPEPPSDEHVKAITDKEKYAVCNEMNVIGPLRSGYIRPLFLAVILVFAKIIRPFSYIPTVQTSRWLQLDGGWRLVFVAYFDNTSEGYANDFVDSLTYTRRVNLLFGHGSGFPSTKWAILSGGADRRGYMDAVRRQGKITNVWYNSHPALSILNIRNNRNIIKGLWGEKDDKKSQEWLHLF